MPIAQLHRRGRRATISFRPLSLRLLLAQVAGRLSAARATPEERARLALVNGARRALRDAERQHGSLLRAKRRELRRAERAHAAALRSARRELRGADRTEGDAIRELEHRLRTVTGARELARYGRLRLYEDRIETGRESIPVVPGLRALVVPGDVLAEGRPGFAVPGQVLGPHGRPRLRGIPKRRRSYLVVETAGTPLAVEARHESAARKFAEIVNVAALNADRFASVRREAGAELEGELALLRERRATAVDQATSRLAAAEADRAAVEAAERALAEAEADTAELTRRRDALASVLRPSGQD